MGVLNVTPDSFWDGGRFFDEQAAVAHGERLAEEGSDLIDVGGESTRPGSRPVPAGEELRRVTGVIERLSGRTRVPLSIDTYKSVVARAALAAGASFVNDVSGLRNDPQLAGVVAEARVDVCLVHMKGEPATMQENPRYEDVVSEVKGFLERRLAFAVAEGVSEERVWLDPGIGFGKTVDHNLELLRRLDEIVAIGRPVVVGASRKRFIGAVTGRPEGERLPGSLAAAVLAFERGASMLRTHDVAATRGALAVAGATLEGRGR
jgi:dihydropteroate synthase